MIRGIRRQILPTWKPTHLPTYLTTYLPTCLSTYLHWNHQITTRNHQITARNRRTFTFDIQQANQRLVLNFFSTFSTFPQLSQLFFNLFQFFSTFFLQFFRIWFNLWHLRHWLQHWQLRTWNHENLCYLTINCDTVQHSQFLRCFIESFHWSNHNVSHIPNTIF